MPGSMLAYSCPCGFMRRVNVGCILPDFVDSIKGKLIVAAYDTDKERLVGMADEEAQDRGFTVYPDPFTYDPFKWIVEKDESAAPLGPDARFECPKCHQRGLGFNKVGYWD